MSELEQYLVVLSGIAMTAFTVWWFYRTPQKIICEALIQNGDGARHWKSKLKYILSGTLIVFLLALIVFGGDPATRDFNLFSAMFLLLWIPMMIGIFRAYSLPDENG